jgi:hypothetical protein
MLAEKAWVKNAIVLDGLNAGFYIREFHNVVRDYKRL